MENKITKSASPPKQVDYEKIAQSTDFKELVKTKNKFIIPLSIFFLVFYFALPLMTSYSKVLNAPAIGDISWVWVFAFGQFIMTWTLCMMYVKKANSFDIAADKILKDHKTDGEGE